MKWKEEIRLLQTYKPAQCAGEGINRWRLAHPDGDPLEQQLVYRVDMAWRKLSDWDRMILGWLFAGRRRGGVVSLAWDLELHPSTVYRYRDKALSNFRMELARAELALQG